MVRFMMSNLGIKENNELQSTLYLLINHLRSIIQLQLIAWRTSHCWQNGEMLNSAARGEYRNEARLKGV